MTKQKLQCAMCGDIFESEREDEDARQECIDNFGELAILDNLVVVCDDCYNIIDPNKYPDKVDKARKEFWKKHQ